MPEANARVNQYPLGIISVWYGSLPLEIPHILTLYLSVPQCPPLECGHQSPKVPSTQFSRDISPPHTSPPTASPSLPGRASDSLTPPSGRGRSPLHCHPSPWPGGRGSRHSARLSCPESSLARRWSASSHGGSIGRGNGWTTRGPAENPGASADTPALVPPDQPSLQNILEG